MKNKITESDCKKIYEEYNTPEHIVKHCMGVSRAGELIAKAINRGKGTNYLDVDLVKYSGMLHDFLRLNEPHGENAAKMLREKGYFDIAEVVENHMHYSFNPIEKLDETDVMCIADRVVKEDKYVGLDARIDYLIHKPGENEERTKRLLKNKEITRKYMNEIEKIMNKTFDEVMEEF